MAKPWQQIGSIANRVLAKQYHDGYVRLKEKQLSSPTLDYLPNLVSESWLRSMLPMNMDYLDGRHYFSKMVMTPQGNCAWRSFRHKGSDINTIDKIDFRFDFANPNGQDALEGTAYTTAHPNTAARLDQYINPHASTPQGNYAQVMAQVLGKDVPPMFKYTGALDEGNTYKVSYLEMDWFRLGEGFDKLVNLIPVIEQGGKDVFIIVPMIDDKVMDTVFISGTPNSHQYLTCYNYNAHSFGRIIDMHYTEDASQYWKFGLSLFGVPDSWVAFNLADGARFTPGPSPANSITYSVMNKAPDNIPIPPPNQWAKEFVMPKFLDVLKQAGFNLPTERWKYFFEEVTPNENFEVVHIGTPAIAFKAKVFKVRKPDLVFRTLAKWTADEEEEKRPAPPFTYVDVQVKIKLDLTLLDKYFSLHRCNDRPEFLKRPLTMSIPCQNANNHMMTNKACHLWPHVGVAEHAQLMGAYAVGVGDRFSTSGARRFNQKDAKDIINKQGFPNDRYGFLAGFYRALKEDISVLSKIFIYSFYNWWNIYSQEIGLYSGKDITLTTTDGIHYMLEYPLTAGGKQSIEVFNLDECDIVYCENEEEMINLYCNIDQGFRTTALHDPSFVKKLLTSDNDFPPFHNLNQEYFYRQIQPFLNYNFMFLRVFEIDSQGKPVVGKGYADVPIVFSSQYGPMIKSQLPYTNVADYTGDNNPVSKTPNNNYVSEVKNHYTHWGTVNYPYINNEIAQHANYRGGMWVNGMIWANGSWTLSHATGAARAMGYIADDLVRADYTIDLTKKYSIRPRNHLSNIFSYFNYGAGSKFIILNSLGGSNEVNLAKCGGFFHGHVNSIREKAVQPPEEFGQVMPVMQCVGRAIQNIPVPMFRAMRVRGMIRHLWYPYTPGQYPNNEISVSNYVFSVEKNGYITGLYNKKPTDNTWNTKNKRLPRYKTNVLEKGAFASFHPAYDQIRWWDGKDYRVTPPMRNGLAQLLTPHIGLHRPGILGEALKYEGRLREAILYARDRLVKFDIKMPTGEEIEADFAPMQRNAPLNVVNHPGIFSLIIGVDNLIYWLDNQHSSNKRVYQNSVLEMEIKTIMRDAGIPDESWKPDLDKGWSHFVLNNPIFRDYIKACHGIPLESSPENPASMDVINENIYTPEIKLRGK